MRTSLLLIAMGLILSVPAALAQEAKSGEAQTGQRPGSNSKSKFSDRVYLGGNFSMQFGNITAIDLSPMVGYRFSETFSAGPGFTYQYVNYKNLDISRDIIGYRVFARKMLNEQIFVYGEYENLFWEYYDPFTGISGEGWVPGLLAGGGLFQPIGRKAGVMITVLYNLAYDDIRSPYASPLIVRAGFTL